VLPRLQAEIASISLAVSAIETANAKGEVHSMCLAENGATRHSEFSSNPGCGKTGFPESFEFFFALDWPRRRRFASHYAISPTKADELAFRLRIQEDLASDILAELTERGFLVETSQAKAAEQTEKPLPRPFRDPLSHDNGRPLISERYPLENAS
jgi:hypothetical protein